ARRPDYVRVQDWLGGFWKGHQGGPETNVPDVETNVPRERLSALLEQQTVLPEDFRPHKQIERLLQGRRQMARGEKVLDWGAAEALAFATLGTDGTRVRFTGQDAARGTFSHRHAVLFDQETGRTFMPLCHLAPDQAPIEIYNSPLSEAAVL